MTAVMRKNRKHLVRGAVSLNSLFLTDLNVKTALKPSQQKRHQPRVLLSNQLLLNLLQKRPTPALTAQVPSKIPVSHVLLSLILQSVTFNLTFIQSRAQMKRKRKSPQPKWLQLQRKLRSLEKIPQRKIPVPMRKKRLRSPQLNLHRPRLPKKSPPAQVR